MPLSNFEITCPHCGKISDYTGDNWYDELLDDSEDHEIECLHCGKKNFIRVNATYTLEVVNGEYDDE